MVVRPIGEFRSSIDYQYQLLRCNVDLLKIIQLGLTFTNEKGEYPSGINTWQFNFKFNLTWVFELGNNFLFPSAGVMLSFGECPCVPHCWLILSNKNSDSSTGYVGTYFGVPGVNNGSGVQSYAKILSLLPFLLIILCAFFFWNNVWNFRDIYMYIYIHTPSLSAKNKWMCWSHQKEKHLFTAPCLNISWDLKACWCNHHICSGEWILLNGVWQFLSPPYCNILGCSWNKFHYPFPCNYKEKLSIIATRAVWK